MPGRRLAAPYARGMGRGAIWREGESPSISVTPVSRGVVAPLALALALGGLVVVGAQHWSVLRTREGWALLVVVAPVVVLLLTRTWRWRSHKVHVTNERLLLERGVTRRFHTSIEMRDVTAVRVEQGLGQRLRRRGSLFVETAGGTFHVGVVRHPSALARLIDAERTRVPVDRLAFDTVFDFEDPSPPGFRLFPPPGGDRPR
jgi:uncharacterized membrane protein YdbT with pleckstrin-like domain